MACKDNVTGCATCTLVGGSVKCRSCAGSRVLEDQDGVAECKFCKKGRVPNGDKSACVDAGPPFRGLIVFVSVAVVLTVLLVGIAGHFAARGEEQ